MNSNQISLLIFTCEGREHLLPTTLQSLNKTCNYPFEHTILAIDGQYSNETIKIVKPKFIVQNYNRRGYIQSILNALKLVETDFFFWLEDDWVFTQEIDLQYLLEELNINPDWVQIRLSKTAPLSSGEKKNSLTDRVYESIYGFSANPCLCRTNLVYQGFDALKHESRDPTLGFEQFLSQWFDKQRLFCGVLDPGEESPIEHTGYLESTPRQWHMTASLNGETNEYLSGMRGSPSPSIWRRLLMACKLTWAYYKVLICQLWQREAYDLAFRFVATTKKTKVR